MEWFLIKGCHLEVSERFLRGWFWFFMNRLILILSFLKVVDKKVQRNPKKSSAKKSKGCEKSARNLKKHVVFIFESARVEKFKVHQNL